MHSRFPDAVSGKETFGERQAPRTRIEIIAELAGALSEEAESLLLDPALAETPATAHGLDLDLDLDLDSGFDFCEEVRRFEVRLIKLALGHTNSNQARAARLLSMASSTLHYKIKSYHLL